jgi:large subunit ribosomal protein L5
MANLRQRYEQDLKEILKKEFSYKNPFQVPNLGKVVVSCGLGEATTEPKIIDTVSEQLAKICGQKPVPTIAKKSISAFRLKKGDQIGLKVTLRGAKMYDFLEKLVRIILPRLRDFRGVKEQSFDSRGNYTIGIREMTIFPEVEYTKGEKTRGLEITIVTTAKKNEEAKRLLELFGIPFSKEGVRH